MHAFGALGFTELVFVHTTILGGKMKRIPVATAALLVITLLAACAIPTPTREYRGFSITGGDAIMEVTLTLNEPTAAGTVRGTYYAGVARGTLHGELDRTTLTAVLEPKSDCTFSFTGTLTDASLTGAFELLDCEGGEPGTWDLNRT